MPIIQPAIALSTRQEAFRNHYHEKTRVNMSFHDTPQQPAPVAQGPGCTRPRLALRASGATKGSRPSDEDRDGEFAPDHDIS